MTYKERYHQEKEKEIKRAERIAGAFGITAVFLTIIGLSAIETVAGTIMTALGFISGAILLSNADYYETIDDEDDEEEETCQ